MIEIIEQLEIILKAETLAGGLLAGAETTINDNELPSSAKFVAISAVEESFPKSQGWDYEVATGYAFVTVMVKVSEKKKMRFELAAAEARLLGRAARQVLLQNRKLITEDYPQGIVSCETETGCIGKVNTYIAKVRFH